MKIWLDFCEPKSISMLRPLYNELIKEHDVFITARDFDSTFYLLDKWGVPYIKTGIYGGGALLSKLKSYSERLSRLINIIEGEKPNFLFCITSPEAIRIAFGLQLPHIMFNDEPRSFGCCSLTLPFVNQLIVPRCIPIEWFLKYGIKEEKIIRFNGIDEVGWLNREIFNPNDNILKKLNLEKEKYIVCRTEPTKAGYLINKMEPHETLLSEIIPKILKFTGSELKYLIITRNQEQFDYLNKHFKEPIKKDNVRIYRGISDMANVMYFSKMVLTGGGTMVRESALMGIPSIEFFPLKTYPQEQFLIKHGFPLKHTHNVEETVETFRDYLDNYVRKDTFIEIDKLENPIKIGIYEFNKKINPKTSN